ncbi:hypothetical protein DYI42_19170 [Vannielia litorea]|nr:hypothetical protein [Vannielia litorea]
MNPFEARLPSLSGPALDLAPVTPDDDTDLPAIAVSLYIETGGDIVVDTMKGETRTVTVADFSIFPVGVRRVRATGTDASGIHALLVD